jgi:putative transposase
MLAMPSTHTSLHIHIVFSTKGRVPLIDAGWRSDLHAYLGGSLKRLEAFPQEIGGVADHVHLLIGIKPVHAIADLVKEAKRVSTEWVRDSKHIRGFAWQEGYGAFSVSKSAVSPCANTSSSRRSIIRSERSRRSIANFWKSMASTSTNDICGESECYATGIASIVRDPCRGHGFFPRPFPVVARFARTTGYPP